MGFWKKLFGLEKKADAKFDAFAVDGDGDGKVQDGTIWERPAALSVDLDKTLQEVEQLLKEVAPSQDLKVADSLAKKAKAQARTKKAAATKSTTAKAKSTSTKKTADKKPAAKKPATKKTQPKKK